MTISNATRTGKFTAPFLTERGGLLLGGSNRVHRQPFFDALGVGLLKGK
jgi:hypothetical protein